MAEDAVQEVGAQTGLKVRDRVSFGMYRGYLVALSGGQYDMYTSTVQYRLVALFPEEADWYKVDQNIDKKALLKMVKGMGQVKVESGFVSITFTPKWRRPKTENVRALLDAVIEALSAATPTYTEVCTECTSTDVDVVLVNGLPKMMCPTCLDKMARGVMAAHEAYTAQSPRYGEGLMYAVPAMIGAAFVWAIIAYATGWIFFLTGILIGLAVSYSLAHGAKRVTGGVIGLGVFLTILSVLIGQVFYVIFILMGEGIPLSFLGEALGIYVTEFAADFGFSMMTAVFGALLAAGYLHSEKKKKQVGLDVVT
jgi:hypothetical protein